MVNVKLVPKATKAIVTVLCDLDDLSIYQDSITAFRVPTGIGDCIERLGIVKSDHFERAMKHHALVDASIGRVQMEYADGRPCNS